MEGWSSEATGVSIDPISGSGCSSWCASCCGIVLFSFSASVAGSSISATVASLALTAFSAAGTGVSSTALPCGHTAAHRATHAAIIVTITMQVLVIGNIPLLYWLNQDWYDVLMHTPLGQALLAAIAAVMFISTAAVIKLTQPIEYRR